MPLHIINQPVGGGSGTGMSHYKTAAICGRRAALDAEIRNEKLGGNYGADTGTFFHSLAETYHGLRVHDIAIELEDIALTEAKNEAERLFIGYRDRHNPDYFGKVIETEQHLPGEEPDKGTEEWDEWKDRKDRLECGLSVSPWTCRIDMVVYVSMEDLDRLCTVPGLEDMLEPGIYLVDHKTMRSIGGKTIGEKCQALHDKFAYDMQMEGYQMAWDILNPDTPCRGMIVNGVTRAKNISTLSFPKTLIHPPSVHTREVIADWLLSAQRKVLNSEPNASTCNGLYGICRHLTEGRCVRK